MPAALPLPAPRDESRVRLLGLDFGSTTSSVLLAEVGVGRHSVSGRMGFEAPRILYRSEQVFTPFCGERLDEVRLAALLDPWLDACDLARHPAFAGAALITGLAAQRDNAQALARLVQARVGPSLIAAADDPCLESWLAFMGSVASLSRLHAGRPILNLDIGGGTTNPALGLGGQVLACGCHYIGARHLRVEPGSYRLTGLSRYAQILLDRLGLRLGVGQVLDEAARERVLGWQVAALEAIALGRRDFFTSKEGRLHQQVPFELPEGLEPPAITFSGGVGELIYRHLAGEPWPSTTAYGDLGIDLARAILRSPVLTRSLALVPEHRGRATVHGLTLHSCEVSGASLHLPDPAILPLRDLPIVARLACQADEAQLERALALAARRPQGACLQLECAPGIGLAEIRGLGQRLARVIARHPALARQPLVLLLEANAGKTLGHYASDWNRLPCQLVVIDEIPLRNAQFLHIGEPLQQVVPVSFFGLA